MTGKIGRFPIGAGDTRFDLLRSVDLLQHGGANLISLGPLSARLGCAWERKRSLVWDFVERRSRELGGCDALTVRISEVDFLMMLSPNPEKSPRGVCLRIVEATFLHFLGDFSLTDVVIRQVTGIGDNELEVRDCDLSQLPQSADDRRAVGQAQQPGTDITRGNPVRFRSQSGLDLQIDFRPRAVMSLRSEGAVGIYIDRQVRNQAGGAPFTLRDFDNLPDHDLAMVDEETMVFARNFLPAPGTALGLAVIVPASFRTASSRRGRDRLFSADYAGADALVLELYDISAGTPGSRVTEAAALGRVFTKAMLARYPVGVTSFDFLYAARLRGFLVQTDELKAFAQARGLSPCLLLDGAKRAAPCAIALEGASQVAPDCLAALGYTHRCGGAAT